MTNQMHAAESLDDTACSGQRALTHPSGGAMRAARNQIARPAAARSGGAVPAGIVPGPAASHPLAGEGSSAAGMDVFSLQTHPAVSDGRRVLSREEYVRIATPLLAAGATWREVGEACGISARAAQHRAAHVGLVSRNRPGRPKGSVNSPETMARIAETLRRRWLEGRR